MIVRPMSRTKTNGLGFSCDAGLMTPAPYHYRVHDLKHSRFGVSHHCIAWVSMESGQYLGGQLAALAGTGVEGLL